MERQIEILQSLANLYSVRLIVQTEIEKLREKLRKMETEEQRENV